MKVYAERNKDGYYYIHIGTVEHYAPQFKIWVNRALIEKDEKGEFVRVDGDNRTLMRTEKGSLVLRPSEYSTYIIGRACGYRGGSSLEILKGEVIFMLPFEEFESERGSLGVSSYAVVTAKGEITVKEEASGRLYGAPAEIIKRYTIEGGEAISFTVAEDDDELAELLN